MPNQTKSSTLSGTFCASLVCLAACTGPVSPFEALWSMNETIAVTCPDSTATLNQVDTIGFTSTGPNGLTYTSEDGCVFDFTVSGNVATLSNGPVSCAGVVDGGGSIEVTFTSYTATLSSNDAQLTTQASSTTLQNGVTCTETLTGTSG